MKNIRIIALLFVLFCLSSCVDIEEHYNFKADGSCNVVYSFDMSRALSVLMNLMTDSVKQTPEFGMKKDTTLNFYSALPDSTRLKMTAEETNMTKSSSLGIKMDLKKSVMRLSINHNAKDVADLQYYLQHISKISMAGNELTGAVKNVKQNNGFDTQQLVAGQDYYSYDVTPHKFYRIIDKTKFNAFLKKTASTFAMAKALLIDMPYKVVLNFAKPVKKVSNPKAIISADRKQVTLIADMNEMIKDPTVGNLKIDF
jgi:hypothetical protein